MKKSFYVLTMLLGFAIVGCEPMEDIHDDIDASIDNQAIEGDIDYTLVEEDYTADPEDGGLGLRFPNFNSLEDARDLIPKLLQMKYPVWGEGSLANVTFNIYSPVDYPEEVISYEVTTEDYDSYEETARFDNFDDMSQIYTFLNDKFGAVEDETLVSLTYEFYDGSTNTLNNGFLWVDGQWQFIPGITEEQYQEMGENYPNFSSVEEAEEKLPVFLEDKFEYNAPEVGQVEPVMYKWYNGEDQVEVAYFIWNGNEWALYDNLVTETAQFGFIDGGWMTDNTIQHTLAPSDYAFLSTYFETKYPDPAWSVGNYNNFDRRSGNKNEWTDEMLLEAMNVLLNEKVAPNAEEGQKYVLTFAIYNGSNTTESLSLIKQNDVWVKQE